MHVELIPVRDLHPHPHNPRGKFDPDDPAVVELAQSIKANGLLSPLVVRVQPLARPGYQVLTGHRRLAALKSIAKEMAYCHVVQADDGEAAAIMLTDNLARVDLDPLHASDLVASMVKGHKGDGSVKAVSDRLGKTVRWVAQAVALANLDPKIRKEIDAGKKPLAGWSVPMLVALAEVAPECQAEALEGAQWDTDELQVRESLVRWTRRLCDAPFDLTDATLDKKAGPCSTCPKHSAACPGLFAEEADPKDLKTATCRDVECLNRKSKAFAQRGIDAARAEHGKSMIAVHGGDVSDQDCREFPVEAEWRSDYSPAKKDEKGAVPAYVVTGKARGKVVYLKKKSAARIATETISGHAPKPQRPAAEKRKIERLRLLYDAAQIECDQLKQPAAGVVLGLVAVYGWMPEYRGRREPDAKGMKTRFAIRSTESAFAEYVWPDVRRTVSGLFDRHTGDDVLAAEEECRWIAGELGLPWDEASALEQVPEPAKKDKAAKPRKESKPEVQARVKKVLAKLPKAKKPVVGRCVACQCEDEKPCPDGCHWVDDRMTKCSSCFDEKGNLLAYAKKGGKKKRAALEPAGVEIGDDHQADDDLEDDAD